MIVLALLGGFLAAKEREWVGSISDDHCLRQGYSSDGSRFGEPNHADCARLCVRYGDRYALRLDNGKWFTLIGRNRPVNPSLPGEAEDR